MSQEEIISKVKEAVKEDPIREYVKSISLFGSFLHGNFTDKSDVDLLFEKKKAMGFFTLMKMQRVLEEKLGRKVDFIPKDSLDKYIRDEIIAESKKIYDEND